MKNICTISDKNYLPLGLCLIESLNKHNENITIYYLCVDTDTFDYFSNNPTENVVPIRMDSVIQTDDRLKNITATKGSIITGKQTKTDPAVLQLLFCMSSVFPEYCLKTFHLDHILYCDSDLFFYESLNSVYEDVGDKSFGIVEHRIPPNPRRHLGEYCAFTDSGRFNVGVVYFKASKIGFEIIDFWKLCMLTTTEYAVEYGGCGDQKYLELIYKKYVEHIAVIGKKTGHLAPWNLIHHRYTHNEIVWDSMPQPLIYFHFSGFAVNDSGYFIGARHGVATQNVGIDWLDKKINEYHIALKEKSIL